ncbi:MAG: CoA pyrophosphatase, partial [Candidatus Tectomicrobia bacterium]|nr:CoA pyrophosphatase [Candidatus Tectomicrobia bacterium]
SWLKDHAGQISFPGGRRDREDKSLTETALRETFEEIGIHASHVEILGQLDDVVTRSNYVITPYVGTFPHPYQYTIDTHEVAEILEVPLSLLLDKQYFRGETQNSEALRFPPPLWFYREHIIWGATARIVERFLGLVFNF